MNAVEQWKREKHGFDVWPDVLRYASERAAMKSIPDADLERMKWHGVFYRKRDGDGTYMLRLRATAGELTAEQAKAAAYVAYDCGYGIIDVTTRANLQIQGLAIDDVPAALERLESVGLLAKQTGHDNVRNVFGHPLSGLDPEELIDTRPLCRAITELFIGHREYADLPRKFNVALCGRAPASLHFWSQDLAFVACRGPDDRPMFRVLLGGKQGQAPALGEHLPVLVPPERAVEVTAALLDLFRAQGSREKRDRARFRFLLERIGIRGVLEHLDQNLESPLIPYSSAPESPIAHEDLVGWFPEKQAGRWSLGLCVPVGRLGWQQLDGLALVARKWGRGTLRLTPDQGVIVPGVATGFRDAAATAAARHGLSPHADSVVRNVLACTGKQFCNIAVTETKAHALKLVEDLRHRALALHGIRIHMSGCPSACVQHHMADIGLKGVRVRRLLGTREGFDVYLGGGINSQLHLGAAYKTGVDVEQLPQLIEDVVREFYLRHLPGQTFSSYWRERLADAAATTAGESDYHQPIWECDRCGHHFHGEDPPIYCPQCAGLRRHFARLELSEPGGPSAAAPAPLAAPATTQGVVRTDGFVFAATRADIKPGTGLLVEVAGRELALFDVDGEVRALDNQCPHAGGPLSEGTLSDGAVACPWHDWTFDASTGASRSHAGKCVSSHETLVDEGRVFVRIKSP